jgi:hypothetical protein
MKIMGIDKLRLISTQFPRPEFVNEVNEDQMYFPKELRKFDARLLSSNHLGLQRDSVCKISTRRGIEPQFYLHTNFQAFPGDVIRHLVEFNPNKLRNGYLDLVNLLDRIFGPYRPDLKISRMDPCADIEMPVDFFRFNMRIPRKRKNTEFAELDTSRTYSNRGVTGFYIGANPSLLRVYDKREEMKRLRQEVDYLPPILTRVEWELRHKKLPITWLSQFRELLDYQPFEKIEICETDRIYDFNYDTENSRKKFLLDRLTDEYGRQEAIRIVNRSRNFKRDYGSIVMKSPEIIDRLHQSYRDGVTRFFNNECADVRFRYLKAPAAESQEGLHQC